MSVRVSIPSPLRSYTGKREEVFANGRTVTEVLWDLDRQFPGIRFRVIDEQDNIRRHIRIFVNAKEIATLETTITPADDIQILQALSGG